MIKILKVFLDINFIESQTPAPNTYTKKSPTLSYKKFAYIDGHTDRFHDIEPKSLDSPAPGFYDQAASKIKELLKNLVLKWPSYE